MPMIFKILISIMYFSTALIFTTFTFMSEGSPVTQGHSHHDHGHGHGHLNSYAEDSGASMVDIEKDVVLSPGAGGNNFNAESDSSGQALVLVGGSVHGSTLNRSGEEFNAKSKHGGASQVIVRGDLQIQNVDPNTKKFDAISESGGQSLVQVGNVLIVSGQGNDSHSRDGKALKRKGQQVLTRLDEPWGAAAVAEHNSRPWEDQVYDDPTGGGVPNNNVDADESDLFHKPSHPPHDDPNADNSQEHNDHLGGNLLNADSKGHGSKSIVKVKGMVVSSCP